MQKEAFAGSGDWALVMHGLEDSGAVGVVFSGKISTAAGPHELKKDKLLSALKSRTVHHRSGVIFVHQHLIRPLVGDATGRYRSLVPVTMSRSHLVPPGPNIPSSFF